LNFVYFIPFIFKHAGPEGKGNNPTTGLTLLWACKPFRENSNYWQVSQVEAGEIMCYVRLFDLLNALK